MCSRSMRQPVSRVSSYATSWSLYRLSRCTWLLTEGFQTHRESCIYLLMAPERLVEKSRVRRNSYTVPKDRAL